MKKRILIANDASFLGSGYGVYGKELLTKLHNTGKYEIAELGCYADKNTKYNPPWKFYPNAVGSNDKRFELYKSNPQNQFGAWRFDRILLDFQPHIVFDVRDYWMYSYQENTCMREYFHWIIMPTVDSAPQKTEWLFTFANADMVVPYTQWAKNVLEKSCGKTINLFPKVANAGVNEKVFFSFEDKVSHKTKILGKNYEVIGSVMRNQKRKLLPDILLSFRKYLNYLIENGLKEKSDNTILYMHTSYPEDNGWDLPALLLEYQVIDKVYFSYKCKNCNAYFASKFKGALTHCPKCEKNAGCFTSVSNHVDDQTLNEIYNLFDLFVQCAICEGFGMPQVEAACCGIPIASVDYSAMTEIVENLNGYKIPLARLIREMETNADRASPSIDGMVEIFKDFFVVNDEEYRKNKSKETRDLCLQQYTWSHVSSVWEECFDSVDISAKKDWKSAEISNTNHETHQVPNGLNSYELIEYMTNIIANDPKLFHSASIQSILRDAVFGIVSRGGAVRGLNMTDITAPIENFISNKINAEKARINPRLLNPEDYLL